MQKIGSFVRDILTPLVILMTGGLVAHDHFYRSVPGAIPGVVNGRALGRAYAPIVVSSLADGWIAAAEALERGQSVSEAQGVLQSTWQSIRTREFRAKVAPEFSSILPEGSEPTDPARRTEVIRLWREFAEGLKGGR
ncbi:hypothetical protein P12x_003574 [Tundrisphaera lichenicola]|uniref:hypothetical protein n=1 Tax=Tundrisphaera lichenicola TaxID=2029860 RepID=UPI003EB72B50